MTLVQGGVDMTHQVKVLCQGMCHAKVTKIVGL